MGTISLGDTVEGIGVNSGARYQGRVISLAQRGMNPRIQVTKVNEAKTGSAPVGATASILNMRKVEEMVYAKNLIGPKPEPVTEPKFVAPFQSDGRNVVDANNRVVMRIVKGGYVTNRYQEELPMAEAYELARITAVALTAYFDSQKKAVDSPSPF